ncbi:MAG: hypothetical protein H0T69_11005 [Thermoleophilaceae bacterium]|nr:hypothetical protein [Thermoleophilaceae bacterium]
MAENLTRQILREHLVDKVFEFTGPGTADLSVPERGTIANMIAELGATAAVFPPDDNTREWLSRQEREEDFAELGPEPTARTTTASRSTWPSSARWSPSPRTRTTSCRWRRWPARRSSRPASDRRSTPPTSTSPSPARYWPRATAAGCTSA